MEKPNNFTTRSSVSRPSLPLPQHSSLSHQRIFSGPTFAGGWAPRLWQSTSSRAMVALRRNAQGRTRRRSFYISRLGKSCEASLTAGVKVFQDEISRPVAVGLSQLTTALLTHTSGHTCFAVHRESIWLCLCDIRDCTTSSPKPLVPAYTVVQYKRWKMAHLCPFVLDKIITKQRCGLPLFDEYIWGLVWDDSAAPDLLGSLRGTSLLCIYGECKKGLHVICSIES